MKYYYAPLEGITDDIFRRMHRKYFPGTDRYYTPFLSPTATGPALTKRDRRDVAPENNEGVPLVPQILTNHGEIFLRGAQALKELGYQEVNLNLGCPSGTVCAKGKGAGFLAQLQELERFLDEVFEKCPIAVSVKTRLGKNSPDEFEALLALYNRYPIRELTVHPRVQQDFYRHPVRMEGWDYATAHSAAPLCLSGGIGTKPDAERILKDRRQPGAVMLGRGLVANPALVMQLKGTGTLTRSALEDFHGELFELTAQRLDSPRNTMFRMKEIWGFMALSFEGREKYQKAIRKATTLTEYQGAVARMFRDLPLRENAEISWV